MGHILSPLTTDSCLCSSYEQRNAKNNSNGNSNNFVRNYEKYDYYKNNLTSFDNINFENNQNEEIFKSMNKKYDNGR